VRARGARATRVRRAARAGRGTGSRSSRCLFAPLMDRQVCVWWPYRACKRDGVRACMQIWHIRRPDASAEGHRLRRHGQ
jgi:hypothetical protein